MSKELNKAPAEQAGTNVGHGHVFPRADGVKMRCGGPGLCSECAADASRARAALAQPSPAQADQPTADDYEEVLADHRRLVREMDVLLNGEACAAKQAMLCDLVSQVEAEVRKSGQPLLVSAERYRWLRNDDNWGADDSEGQGTSKWANLGELSGTDFDAYLDQLRGSNPVMDIDPEHSKAIAKRGRDAIVAQADCIYCQGSKIVSTTDTDHNGDHIEMACPKCTEQAEAEAERQEVVDFNPYRYHAEKIRQRADGAASAYEAGRSALGYMEDIAESALIVRNGLDELSAQHERITAKLHDALDESDGDRWKMRSERDAANARLHEVATACATAEQERDAALAEVERLRESKGDPSGSFDRCMKMMYERDENAKRLDAALARVAELETALTPFAAVADAYDDSEDDDHEPYTDMGCDDRLRLTLSQHRAARTALSGAPAQAQQLHDMDKQCRDDVARALGLRPNEERGFAWSYLLASIKACVKASENTAQAQHSVPAYVNYTTRPAESLAGIALRQLKDESRWVEIRDINAHAFPNMQSHSYYPAGTVIKLPAAAPGKSVPQAWLDVLAERRRQVEAEGWTPEHDDLYCAAELPRAAAAYILSGANDEAPAIWPFLAKWWKPRDARANYMRAGALILAEIERLDRAAAPGKEGV